MSRGFVVVLALLIPFAAGLSLRHSTGHSTKKIDQEEVQASHGRTGGSLIVWKPAHAKIIRGDKYVVLNLFCGRKHQMQVTLKHVENLLKAGEIDEVHLNVLDFKTATDLEFLKKYADAHGIMARHLTKSEDYSPAYTFYAKEWKPPRNMESKTVIVKMDDDVIDMDEAKFGKFTDYVQKHPEMFMVMGNVVNNGVTAYYQQKAGAIPLTSNGVDMKMEYPYEEHAPGYDGTLWHEGKKATELHDIFLDKGPQHFEWVAPENDGCIVYRHPGYPQKQGRFSLNFFGAQFDKWGKIAELAAGRYGDEVELTTRNPNQNCIYTDFAVSHLSFGPQCPNGLECEQILQKYAAKAGVEIEM